MKILSPTFLLCVLGLLPSLAAAHHAFRGVYDFSTSNTIEGAVVTLELVNPHARLYLDVTTLAGETERWLVEGPGKLSLARRGWSDDMFAPGDIITAVGNPSNTDDHAIWLEKIVMPDGTEIIDPLVADELAIEAERRERVRQAQQ